MSIVYNVYANDGQGGLVNYSAPIATTSNLSWTVGPLAFPSDNRFGVRAFDTVLGIEEANTDALVRIILDASGNDITNQPNAIVGLSATALAGGACWVTWGYDPAGQGGPPSTFDVGLTAGTTPSSGSPAATVVYQPSVSGYGCTLSGLASNTEYTIAVQAIGVTNLLAGPLVAIGLDYRVALLGNVDSLVGLPIP